MLRSTTAYPIAAFLIDAVLVEAYDIKALCCIVVGEPKQ